MKKDDFHELAKVIGLPHILKALGDIMVEIIEKNKDISVKKIIINCANGAASDVEIAGRN